LPLGALGAAEAPPTVTTREEPGAIDIA
jgi:hypothetical protein